MKRLLLIFSLILSPVMLLAVEPTDCDEDANTQCTQDSLSERPKVETLAGPEQVENRLDIDSNQVTPLFPSHFARGYFDWKDRVKDEHGLGIGGDYSFAYLNASDSPGADNAFGGMYRFFGS